MRDRAWLVCMYGEITPSFRECIVDRTGGQTMLHLVCTTMSRVDHARYEVSYAQEWIHVSGNRVTIQSCVPKGSMLYAEPERT